LHTPHNRKAATPRPDIASPQTGQFDALNSPKPIVLTPIEKPNIIPPSIDTLDKQKTDKSRKIKKRRRKRKTKSRIIQLMYRTILY
jgi:hypothetical protein